jgi:hypothetical protein|nr:MAG TPA: hypothetical protein [Caudoviricetes sp.]
MIDDVSEDYINTAKALLDEHINIDDDPRCRTIINRSYYAIFNKIRKECDYLGISNRLFGDNSHKNTINLFFDYFIKNYPELKGLARYTKKISLALSSHRQNADYHKNNKDLNLYISKDKVGTLVGFADKILEDIDCMMEEVDNTDIQEK